MKPSQCRG